MSMAAMVKDPATRTAACVLVVALAMSSWLAYRLDQQRAGAPPDEVLYLQTPRAVRYLSGGYTGLAACIYWTRAVQYFGEKNQARAKRFDLLPPLLNLTVSLDPHLVPAYEFGAIFLSQAPPFGAGMPDAAVAFVESGIKNNANDWRLYYHLGFIHYMERHDYKAAADAFSRAAKVAGNPPWMNAMPALMLQRAGDLETARLMWTRLYQDAEDETMKRNALTRLVALKVDDDVTHLEAITEAYKQRMGTYPVSWGQLIAERILGGVPADPSGLPYVLQPNGKVVVQDVSRFPFINKGVREGQQAPQAMLPEANDSKSKPAEPKPKPKH